MLRNRKSGSRLRFLFILTLLSAICSKFVTASDDVPVGYKADRYQQVWERNPFTIVTPVAQVAQPKVFDKLVLVSWMNDGGNDVVFVQNIETNEVQKITKEPNPNKLSLVAIHKAPDPKDADAVLSDGTDQGAVKFRLETLTPQTGQQPTVPTAAGVPNPVPGVPTPVLPGTSRQAQAQQTARFGAQQTNPQAQNPAGQPPRASEVRRKRITAPPVTQQPLVPPVTQQPLVPPVNQQPLVPTPALNVPGQPQTQ
jgi:hypothetical protein